MVDVHGLGRPADEIRRSLLHDWGVITVHGSAYGVAGEGTLRVSFAAGGTALEEGLRRLRGGLENLIAAQGLR
jgi:aspartate/methionine/tyrosine aminotransferase